MTMLHWKTGIYSYLSFTIVFLARSAHNVSNIGTLYNSVVWKS